MSLRLDFIGYFDVKKHLIQAGEFEAAGRFDYDAGGILAYGKLCAGIGNCLGNNIAQFGRGELNGHNHVFVFVHFDIYDFNAVAAGILSSAGNEEKVRCVGLVKRVNVVTRFLALLKIIALGD